MILQAIQLARNAHEGQSRRFSGGSYIIHPARVAMRTSLLRYVTEEMIAAAWLHDVLEDTRVTEDEIRAVVGDTVTNLVKELTFVEKDLGEFTYEQRKSIQNAHVAQASFKAKSIKLLDRLDNLADFDANVTKGACDISKLSRYVKTSWDLQKILVSQTEKQVDHDLVTELRVKLLDYNKRHQLIGVIA